MELNERVIYSDCENVDMNRWEERMMLQQNYGGQTMG